MPVAAEEAGRALGVVALKLAQADILTWDGQQVLDEQAARLRKLGPAHMWEVTVDRNRPVGFQNARDKNGETIRIAIEGAQITIDQSEEGPCPVTRLDAAVVIADARADPVARWHIDRANTGEVVQPGPLFHLQFGGHNAGRRELDLPVKEPRWCHPPLDLALLCEIVAANFFMDAWNDKVREDASWCNAIRLFQKLCWETYLRRKLECLEVGRSTALGLMWADRWEH